MNENELLPHDLEKEAKKTKFSFGNTRRLLSAVRRAVDEYHMIGENDRICVGLSGGKDSLTLLTLLSSLRRFYPKKFELFAVHMDPAFYDAGFGNFCPARFLRTARRTLSHRAHAHCRDRFFGSTGGKSLFTLLAYAPRRAARRRKASFLQ